jgi:hypothetical protein
MRIPARAGWAAMAAGGILLAALTLAHYGDDSAAATPHNGSALSALPEGTPADSPAVSAPTNGPYVALGDSYTAERASRPRPQHPPGATAPTATTPHSSPRTSTSRRPTSAM